MREEGRYRVYLHSVTTVEASHHNSGRDRAVSKEGSPNPISAPREEVGEGLRQGSLGFQRETVSLTWARSWIKVLGEVSRVLKDSGLVPGPCYDLISRLG